MKTLLIEVPDDFELDQCGNAECNSCYRENNRKCYIANAKEAAEVKAGDIDRIAPDDILAFGKPAKIYAVEKVK